MFFSRKVSNAQEKVRGMLKAEFMKWIFRFAIIKLRLQLTQHEIMNLRLFMLCVKIRKYETFSIRSNSAMRNGP